MKALVILPIVPFIYGGAEKMATGLVNAFHEYGHKAELLFTPSGAAHRKRSQYISLLTSSLMNLDDYDLCVPLMPTNFGIDHRNVVPWMIGQHKSIYEFFDSTMGLAVCGAEGRIISTMTRKYDTYSLTKLPRKFTISPRVAELMAEYNSVSPTVLPLPVESPEHFECRDYGDFVVYHSRLHSQKRQHLAIWAMKYTKSNVKLIVAGDDFDTPYTTELKRIIADNNLSDKVELRVGKFTEKQKHEWLSTCLGGFYLGEDEDYWAIVTTEFMLSKKPVIAPIDPGATKYVIKDGITGYQPEGTPQAIAEVIDKLYYDKKNARQMGEAGFELIQKVCPSWETVVKTLSGEINDYSVCY
jgi:glycosyltransferase involved in cell wall biosynthesis